jgi:hypothetical protein
LNHQPNVPCHRFRLGLGVLACEVPQQWQQRSDPWRQRDEALKIT